MKYKNLKLENGLTIYAIDFEDSSNVASVNVFYKVGSKDEYMPKSGIAHFLEHLSFKSTKKHKAGEFDAILKSFGASNNACTSFDYTQYYALSKSDKIEKILSLYADMMDLLEFKEEEFYSERDVICEEERLRVKNDPFGKAYFTLYNNAFINHPYHWTPIGFSDDIANLSIEDVRQFYNTFYAPNNAYVVICGDIDIDYCLKIAKELFKDKKSKEIPTKNVDTSYSNYSKKIELDYKESNTNILLQGYKLPSINSKDVIYMSALATFLNMPKMSKIQNDLLDKKRIFSEIEFYSSLNKFDNLFIAIACNQEAIKEKDTELLYKYLKNIKLNKNDILCINNHFNLKINEVKSNCSSFAKHFGMYLCLDRLDIFEEFLSSFCYDLAYFNDIISKYFVDNNLTQVLLRRQDEK